MARSRLLDRNNFVRAWGLYLGFSSWQMSVLDDELGLRESSTLDARVRILPAHYVPYSSGCINFWRTPIVSTVIAYLTPDSTQYWLTVACVTRGGNWRCHHIFLLKETDDLFSHRPLMIFLAVVSSQLPSSCVVCPLNSSVPSKFGHIFFI